MAAKLIVNCGPMKPQWTRRAAPLIATLLLTYMVFLASVGLHPSALARGERHAAVTRNVPRGHVGAPASSHESPPAMPIISRGMPAFASSNIQPNALASYANDNNYGTFYRSYFLPAWVAYDLSSVPPSHRHKVLAVFYNSSYAYDTVNNPHYNNLRSYSIEGNAAKGKGPVPLENWVPLVTVQGNTLHSRQHIFNLKGYNWVRIFINLSDGSPENYDAAFNQFDIYDLRQFKKVTDDWIFYGDSVTADGMVTYPDGGTPSFAELIHHAQPWRWPAVENGGEPFDRSNEGVTRILGPSSMPGHKSYLSLFPGRYVVLSYGLNDASSDASATELGRRYFANMSKLVKAVLKAGKVPVVPKISYTNVPKQNVNVQILNGKIDQLYRTYHQIVHGPDFWKYFQQHPTLIRPGDIHPTADGYGQMRRLWAQTMLRKVY